MNAKTVNTSMTMLRLIFAAVLGGIAPTLASATTIDINPSKDNTLYQYVSADGDRSNALGDHFFAGTTAEGETRRGVIAFDIAGSIPAGSTITSVTLTLNMSRTVSGERTVELHKLLADWGEGTSIASGEEGDGAPATANDATWRHRFYDTIFWTTEGGELFCHGERKPAGWRPRTVCMEFGSDGFGRAVVAGQSDRQLRLAGFGGRVRQSDVEALRYPREHHPSPADYRICGSNSDTYTYT